MKILFFTRFFYPHIGGVEKHVLEISKRLIDKGHDVTIVTEDLSLRYGIGIDTTKWYKRIKIFKIPIKYNNWSKKFDIWFWLFKNRKLIKNADIIHCHDVFFWYLPFRFLFPFKKVFTTFHGYETKYPPSKKAIFVRKLSEKLSFGNICIGDYIKKWYGTVPDYVTHGGTDLVKSSKLKVKSYNDNKIRILFVGRLEEDTGIPVYLKTLEELEKRKIDFQITFLGNGKLKKQTEQFGKVFSRFNDVRHYTTCDLVFASSYLSMLEAMVNKRIIFAIYQNQLKKDYLEMSPFSKYVVIESSPEKLADKIDYYIKNKEKKEELEDLGFKWVKKQSWDKVVELYLKLWNT